MRIMDDGTPRALAPLAEEVLAWVAKQRNQGYGVQPDDLRRIELCAQAVVSYDRLVSSMGES